MAEGKKTIITILALISLFSGLAFIAAAATVATLILKDYDPGGLVAGILACGFFGSPVVALVFGYTARWKDRSEGASTKARRLATAGIRTGWAAVAFVVILLYIMSTDRAHRDSRPYCRSNLKQIGLAMGMYQADYGDELPPRLQTLCDEDYLKSTFVLKCPQDTTGPDVNPRYIDLTSSYWYARAKKPKGTGDDIPVMWDRTLNHGKDGVNVLFYDLHVSFKLLPELQAMIEKNRALYDRPPSMPVEP